MALDLAKLRSYPDAGQTSYALRETALRFSAGTLFDDRADACLLADNVTGTLLSLVGGTPENRFGATPDVVISKEQFCSGMVDLANAIDFANSPSFGELSEDHRLAAKPESPAIGLLLRFFVTHILPLLLK